MQDPAMVEPWNTEREVTNYKWSLRGPYVKTEY